MNTRRMIIATGMLAGSLATMAATAADPGPPLPPQASIPFTNLDTLRDWQSDKRDGLWIQDQRRQWYYAKFIGPCIGLDFALAIGFDTGGSNTLDRFSAVIVPREQRCQIQSLTKSAAPPPHKSKKKKSAAEPSAAP